EGEGARKTVVTVGQDHVDVGIHAGVHPTHDLLRLLQGFDRLRRAGSRVRVVSIRGDENVARDGATGVARWRAAGAGGATGAGGPAGGRSPVTRSPGARSTSRRGARV